MKIRQGFVSNSSTTSFCIFYKDAQLSDIDDKHVYIEISTYESRAIFRPDQDIIDYLKKHPELAMNISFKHVYREFCESEDVNKKILLDDVPEGFKVESGEKDQWQPNNLKEFMEVMKQHED